MDIIHLYKGFKIEKVEKYYAQGREVFYRLVDKNSNLQVLNRLEDIKSFVYQKNIQDDSAFPDFPLDEEVESVSINEYEGKPLLLIDTKEWVDGV